ncbi:MAG: adenine-specific methyltransferase EcoRI family protein, partial [Clostridia bacterium]|nr:adenine-specific methyltransferase EcoRI family protein [Clostridia bacterium]
GYTSAIKFKQPLTLTTCNVLTRWFTNINVKKRHEDLILFRNYTPEKYPKYDNYDAINVDKVNDIPCDYAGLMGVPISFMDKYNPDQFEILGDSRYITGECNDINAINGVFKYTRFIIRNKKLGVN